MEAPLPSDTRMYLEVAITTIKGSALSWQKILIPTGVELSDVQEGIAFVIQRLNTLAHSSDTMNRRTEPIEHQRPANLSTEFQQQNLNTVK